MLLPVSGSKQHHHLILLQNSHWHRLSSLGIFLVRHTPRCLALLPALALTFQEFSKLWVLLHSSSPPLVCLLETVGLNAAINRWDFPLPSANIFKRSQNWNAITPTLYLQWAVQAAGLQFKTRGVGRSRIPSIPGNTRESDQSNFNSALTSPAYLESITLHTHLGRGVVSLH